jgi:hypothetical protein
LEGKAKLGEWIVTIGITKKSTVTVRSSEYLIPSGGVMWFYGDPSNIESPWTISDGNDGTIDLTGAFIKSTDHSGASDGSNTFYQKHSHEVGDFNKQSECDVADNGSEYEAVKCSNTVTNITDQYSKTEFTAEPPYLQLVPIQALSDAKPFSGCIQLWSGLVGNVPDGWVLCNGNNGTPDMKDRFVKGGVTSGNTGGTETIQERKSGTSHTHTVEWENSLASFEYYGDYEAGVHHELLVGDISSSAVYTVDTVPEHYKLAYIQKQ